MSRYLKSYKKYPAGTLVVAKKYSIISRLWYAITCKRRPYNSIYILPKNTYIGITKFDKFKNDYHLFIPKQEYKSHEIKMLNKLIKSCSSTEDYLTLINKIRPNTVDETNLDSLRTNDNYYKIYIE